MCTDSSLVSPAPPCFLPSSQTDGDTGWDMGISSFPFFPEEVGRTEEGERKEPGCEDGDEMLLLSFPSLWGLLFLSRSGALIKCLITQSRPMFKAIIL